MLCVIKYYSSYFDYNNISTGRFGRRAYTHIYVDTQAMNFLGKNVSKTHAQLYL